MSNSTLVSQRVFVILLAACALFVGNGCERKVGKIIDVDSFHQNGFEFMAIRNKTPFYDEYTVGFWCRTPSTISAPRTEYLGNVEPPEYRNKGWRYLGGYAGVTDRLSIDFPRTHLKVITDKVAYVDKGRMAITLDACRTRTYFEISEGAWFSTHMPSKGIHYPGGPLTNFRHLFDAPFLREFRLHEGGGCFEINPEYVDERKQYFYCSSDLGKTWTLEIERKRVSPIAPQPAVEPVAKPVVRPATQPAPDSEPPVTKPL